jgi:ABC-2 type transport system ATP-binding protein
MSEPAIETRGLTRRFGQQLAVSDLTLALPFGMIYGLIGPNGAGKTTTLRLLAGLTPPSSGGIRLAGLPLTDPRTADEARRMVGFMPDRFGVYEDMRAWEYLDFFARCYGVPAPRRGQLVAELLDLVDLADKREADVGTLSRGMQQRLCLAHALVHDPRILLLDEPASGLDPRARLELRELLRELRRMGKTIVVSSHILSEMEDLCDAIGIMERGRLLASGGFAEIDRRLQPRQVVEIKLLPGAAGAALAYLRSRPGVALLADAGGMADGAAEGGEAAVDGAGGSGPTRLDASEDGWIAAAIEGGEAEAASLLADLVRAGLPVLGYRPRQRDLERIFMAVTTGI